MTYQISKHVISRLDLNFFTMINEWILERFTESRKCELKGSYHLEYITKVTI